MSIDWGYSTGSEPPVWTSVALSGQIQKRERRPDLYGDRLVATTGTHGPDIASQRIDDLDRRALEAVLASGQAQMADRQER